jgi:hypothetical protein
MLYYTMLERSSMIKTSKKVSKALARALPESLIERAIEEGKNPAAVALGRLGGLKGGKARAAKLSATRRRAIAKKAALTRWKGHKS